MSASVVRPVDDNGPVWCTRVTEWEWDADCWARSLLAEHGPFCVAQAVLWDGQRIEYLPPTMQLDASEFTAADPAEAEADFAGLSDQLGRAREAMAAAMVAAGLG